MLNKTQILNRIKYLKKINAQYCVAIKTVVGKDETEDRNGAEIRLVPVAIDTAEQYDYTMRFCRIMLEKDGRELVPFSTDKLEYIAIIGANSEEEGNKKIKAVIAEYSKQNGFGKVMSEDTLMQTANECLAECNAS